MIENCVLIRKFFGDFPRASRSGSRRTQLDHQRAGKALDSAATWQAHSLTVHAHVGNIFFGQGYIDHFPPLRGCRSASCNISPRLRE